MVMFVSSNTTYLSGFDMFVGMDFLSLCFFYLVFE